MINAVVTRSASKEIGTNLHTANGSPIENADQIPPPKVNEEEVLEITQFDGMKEVWLANVTSSDFPSEQEKWLDLQVLWEKARSGVDGEFQIMKGKSVRITKTKRGDEIRQLHKRYRSRSSFVAKNKRRGTPYFIPKQKNFKSGKEL
ncbi:hypothetical protein TNCT_15331 [Trichonephila clavata]|uniref:Uncharacterized protein n=1 Tax=Trichonephila clavata TaxID=2740835 RepID=A0A8X6GR84_TRICU|nr:hypothetical protein TNCT_15331 [Trichonephila clavata]